VIVRAAATLALAIAACGSSTSSEGSTSSTGADEAGATGASEGTGGSDASSTSSTSTTSASTADGTGETGGGGGCAIDLPPPRRCLARARDDRRTDESEPAHGGFIVEPDGGASMPCDTYAQDCPRGQKCMPWANDGGPSWNDTTCRPVAPRPRGVGEPCTAEGGPTSGHDDCDIGLMCWGVDPDTNTGECIELCSCSSAQPICTTPDTFCSVGNNGVVPVCIAPCNPLDVGSCGAGRLCVPREEWFVCAPDGSGDEGGAGEPCQFVNVCAPGHVCADAAGVPGCTDAVGCCTALCAVGDDAPCLPGQGCTAWYARGTAPDGCLGTVGVCRAVR
jgi:hypothetical protein